MKKGTLTVTKMYEFAYAHRLPAYQGKCVHLHGHTGKLEIEVRQSTCDDSYPGITVDFHMLKDVIGSILQEVDHTCLNDILNDKKYISWAQQHLSPVLDEQGNSVYAPTSENMLLWVLHRIEERYPHLIIVRARWWESSSSYAEWKSAL